MSNLQARIKAIENSPSVQGAARIERAMQTGDFSELSAAEIDACWEDTQREIIQHPEEWRRVCDVLAVEFGEHAAAALHDFRLDDLDTPTIERMRTEIQNAIKVKNERKQAT